MRKNNILGKSLSWILTIMMVIGLMNGFVCQKNVQAADYSNMGCVRWVKDRARSLLGIELGSIGNGNEVFNKLKSRGFQVGWEPRKNAIACYSTNIHAPGYGHVAYVEDVIGLDVYFSEGGYHYQNNYGMFLGNVGVIYRTKAQADRWSGVSGFQGYVYLENAPKTSSPSVQVTSCDKDDYNIIPHAKIYNPNRSKISICGIQVRDGGVVIGSKEEQFDPRNNTVASGEVWYNCRNELGVTLRPGHTYTWNIYAYVGGTRVETGWQTVKTTGTEKPNKPTFSTSKRHYAVGDTASISWGADINATQGYSVTIKQINGGTYSQTLTTSNYNATSLAFSLPNEGEYQISGYAKGSSSSDESVMNGVITAHKANNVKFIETFDDGSTNILWQGQVKYGYSATAPTGITRKGYTFLGWDREYTNIIEDTTIKARFKKNAYKVTFYDKDDNIIDTQSVLFKDNAVAPTPPKAEAGYVFAGWSNEDWKNVQGDVKVKACYVWKNNDLPVVVTLKKCEYKEDGYIVTYDIKNNPNNKTKGRALFSLRTSTGKLLDTTESNAFSLAKGEEKNNLEMYIPYEGVATYISLYIIDGFTKGIPISATSTFEVTRDWSDWTSKNPGSDVEVETRTEYRYKDLLKTTTRTSVNDGWTLTNKILDNDWNFGSWSSWSRNQYSANQTTTTKREVESKNVSDNNGYSYNVYYYWKDPNKLAFSYYNEGGFKYYEFYDTQHIMYWYGKYQGTDMYRINNNNGGRGAYFDSEVWWYLRTNTVASTNHTEYRYRDGTKGYTYYWNKWDDWSKWSTTAVSANDSKQVEQRTVYRYRAKMSDLEDNSGKKYTVSGKMDSSFSGKEALIQVYKGNEPSDSNNEYIGKVTIESDGSYSHTFVTREEISAKTGNYSVMMAIEGGSEPIYLDTIKAPKAEYTVNFKDMNGKVIETQKVLEGDSATVPKAPEEKNYTFIGWDYGVTNIRDNIDVTAQYIKNKYSVAFVNWNSRDVETQVFSYGDPIRYPEVSDIEGYDFVGWTTTDGRAVSKILENTVLVANYKIQTYTINFYDIAHNLLSTQKVDYGKNAVAPEAPEVDKMEFKGWNNYDFIQVKGNVDVYSNYEYIETTSNPRCDLESCTLDKKTDIHLFAEEGAEIYYTTDGTTPSKISSKYDGKITIDKNTFLQYIAVSPNKNASDVMSCSYLLISSEDDDGALVIKKDTYTVDRGKTEKITYFLSHSNPQIGVQYYSLNEEIASIDEEGIIRGNQVGKTRIFVRTTDCKYADYCDVEVKTDEIDAEKITLNDTYVEATPDTQIQLKAEVYPLNVTEKGVDWYSADNSIATVDENGVVKLVGEGSTTVRAVSKTGTCYAECDIESNKITSPKNLYISDTILFLKRGDKKQLSVYTSDGSVECEWDSMDKNIATIDENGLVTAINKGHTTIYATSKDGMNISSTIVVEDGNNESSTGQVVTTTENRDDGDTTTEKTTVENTTKESNITKKFSNVEIKPNKASIKSVKNKKNKKIYVKWKWQAEVDGYQIQYALNRNFTKKLKTKNINSFYKSSITIKSLQKKKSYYIRIRAFKKNSGVKIYGSWSSARKVKIKK